MKKNNGFSKVFGETPVIGMIHLAGDNPVERALQELSIFEDEGVNGAIIENYHGSVTDVVRALEAASELKSKVILGVNILPNEFRHAFALAKEYGAAFIQLDYVAGEYKEGILNFESYEKTRKTFPEILVLGGVWPKYYHPVQGSDLEADLKAGMRHADAIVVTGEGTGKETPIEKIQSFRNILGNYPLVVGAGITPENAYEQLLLVDGAIVGSSLKAGNDTQNPVDRAKVRELMDAVDETRAYKRKITVRKY